MEKGTEERLDSWDPPTAKVKARTAKPRQLVYQEPMVQPTPKTKNRPGQAQKPAQKTPPPPPPPPPVVATAATTLVKEAAECEDMTTEDAEATEQTQAEEADHEEAAFFRHWLLQELRKGPREPQMEDGEDHMPRLHGHQGPSRRSGFARHPTSVI